MGLNIDRDIFSAEDFQAFSERLYECLEALKSSMALPKFGSGSPYIGAELEHYLVSRAGDAMPVNKALIDAADDERLTVELNQFNLEYNYDPIPLAPNMFARLQDDMRRAHTQLTKEAERLDACAVPIGILPTLERSHLTRQFMTQHRRYQALSKALFEQRGEKFRIHICGDQEELNVESRDVAFEGANTSFQFHLMVPHERFAACFNAVQLVTPLLIAVSANSPILLHRRLWDETRVALFKQSIDSRSRREADWRQPARVCFGHGWVRRNAWELFAEAVALYPPVFPIVSEQKPLEEIAAGRTPLLQELSLHLGTTWPWNRPVYSAKDNGHVRIELRALPAGPSIVDMVANAAFATGLIFGFMDVADELTAMMPFKFAEYNFYRAARSSFDANIIWPNSQRHQLDEVPVVDVLKAVLPIAYQGLASLGMSASEITPLLSIVESRISKQINGARWQVVQLEKFEKTLTRDKACREMLTQYMQWQNSELPVTDWTIC